MNFSCLLIFDRLLARFGLDDLGLKKASTLLEITNNSKNGMFLLQSFILKSVNIERDVLPIVSQCLDGMAQNAENINETEVNFIKTSKLYLVK